jgi:hypothetical protein
MSRSGNRIRVLPRAASAIAVAFASPLSVNSRTDSPRPAITWSEGCRHISPHMVKNTATPRVCAVIGAGRSSSSSIHRRTSLKYPDIHQ